MNFSAPRPRGMDKAVWGRAVLLGLFALFVVWATPVHATRVAKVANRKLKLLANDPRVKRIHLDRPASGMVVWGENCVDVSCANVWGNSTVQQLVFGDETNQVNSLPSTLWDCMFPLGATAAACTPPPADTSGQTGGQQ